jgi:GNAT superfamily N-acetyltransferase
MEIHIAQSDAEIAACYPVMRELRPHITDDAFVSRVRAQEKSGNRLVYCQGPEGTVAGFRFGESLSWGRFLYVDDLVTLQNKRSQGFGAALESWLAELAAREGCSQLHSTRESRERTRTASMNERECN